MDPIALALEQLPNIIGGFVTRKQVKDELGRQTGVLEAQEREFKEAAEKAMQERGAATRMSPAALRAYNLMKAGAPSSAAERAFGSTLAATQTGAIDPRAAAQLALSQSQALGAEQMAQYGRQAEAEKFLGGKEEVLDAVRRRQAGSDLARARSLQDEAIAAGESLEQQKAAEKTGFTQQLFGYAGQLLPAIYTGVSGGVGGLPAMDKGGKVRETPGEFSHDTNPIDIVRDGAKIGEMTGGELIFNPEQSGKMERMAAEGDTELHKYMRSLFKKFNGKK